MKRSILLLIALLLAACSTLDHSLAPMPLTPEVLATDTPTPSPTLTPDPTSFWLSPTIAPTAEYCGWNWATQARRVFSEVLEVDIETAGVPHVDVVAFLDGESCTGPDNISDPRRFAAMTAPVYITVSVADAHDRALLDGYTLAILTVMRQHRQTDRTRGINGNSRLVFDSPSSYVKVPDGFNFVALLNAYPTGEGLLDGMGAQVINKP